MDDSVHHIACPLAEVEQKETTPVVVVEVAILVYVIKHTERPKRLMLHSMARPDERDTLFKWSRKWH